MSRLEMIAGAGLALIMGAGLARVAMPDRPGLRRLSVEGLHIDGEPIAGGQTLVREKSWKPPADIYLIGWTYGADGPGGSPDMMLLRDGMTLFYGPVTGASNPAFYAEGAAVRVQAGQAVTLRTSMANAGPPGHVRASHALIYFVPAEGN